MEYQSLKMIFKIVIAGYALVGKKSYFSAGPRRVIRLALTIRARRIFSKFGKYAEYQIVGEYSVHP